jgi:hypothetical protein
MDTRERTFTLFDAIVLTAALAAGLGVARIARFEGMPFGRFTRAYPPRFEIANALKAASACAALLSMASLYLRLRAPRPRFWELARQPGAVGCVVADLSIAWFGLMYVMVGPKPDLSSILLGGPFAIAMSIGCAWFVIWFDGCWKPEPSWIDRLGRGLCIGWLALPVAYYVSLQT